MNLHACRKILLVRCPNGWVARNDADYQNDDANRYAFESTESLARQLVTLVGHSGWKVESANRDAHGKFIKAPTAGAGPVPDL